MHGGSRQGEPGGSRNRPETQPITHIDGKRPPMLLATGLADETVPPAWQDLYLDAAAGFGAEVTHDRRPGDDHCDIPFSAGSDAARFLLDRVGV